MTQAQTDALKWLTDRGGDGAFVKGGGTLIAQGDIAPHERKTWTALRDSGQVVFYNPANRGYGRARIAE